MKNKPKITPVLIVIFILLCVSVSANDKIKEKQDIEKVDFIHYAKGKEPGKPAKTESCYKLMGVKWNYLPVSYVVNPSNPQGLSEAFVTSAISASAETWDGATSKELFNDIFSINYTLKYGVLDSVNAIAFGDYSNDNVIAITSIWFSRRTKQIIEFDQLYNTRFSWGDATANQDVMDLQNIATHELGHAIGMNDIYSASCTSVTMYGYSGYGETEKRSLEQPDITGMQKIYGI